MKGKALRVGIITAGFCCGFTIFLFPRTAPAIVVDAASLRPLSHSINLVTLSPAFRFVADYSVPIWPKLGAYESIAPSKSVYVMAAVSGAPGVFAWPWWLVIDLLPSFVIGLLFTWVTARRAG